MSWSHLSLELLKLQYRVEFALMSNVVMAVAQEPRACFFDRGMRLLRTKFLLTYRRLGYDVGAHVWRGLRQVPARMERRSDE